MMLTCFKKRGESRHGADNCQLRKITGLAVLLVIRYDDEYGSLATQTDNQIDESSK